MPQERIRRFIVDTFYVSDPAALADDTLLVTSGLVDSTGMLEIISFVESDLGVRVADDEMTPENLESIERIARFVARKQQARLAG